MRAVTVKDNFLYENLRNTNSIQKSSFWQDYDYLEKLKSVPEPSIYNGWIVEGGKNIIYGSGGVGKSILAFSNALEILKNYEDFIVFYLDYDNPVSLPKSRGLLDYLEKYRNRFFYINQVHLNDILNSDISKQLKLGKIRNKLKQILMFIYHTVPSNKKVLVVIDSLQRFVDINEQGELATAFEYMDRTGFTYIILHHQNKLNQFKGLTYIRDSVDSFYEVRSVEKNNDGSISLHSIVADKRRFLTEQEISFKYDFLEIKDILYGATVEKEEAVILRTAISILRKSNELLNQTQLVNKIKEKLEGVGAKKIRAVLKKYKSKGLFIEKTGINNAKYYEVNENSHYIPLLFNNELSEVKKELFSFIQELENIEFELTEGCPIEVRDKSGTIKVYPKLQAIKNDLFRIDDEVAELILKDLKSMYDEYSSIGLV